MLKQFLLSITLVFSLVVSAEAHNGRKNAEGCHNQKSDNTYHCHNGATTGAESTAGKFVRKDYGYKRPKRDDNIGFYSDIEGCVIEYDHIVSLHDAHYSGAAKFTKAQRKVFANDSLNLVPSCRSINRMKNKYSPSKFWTLSTDNKGIDVEWKNGNWCEYVQRYYQVKVKYGLSFSNNKKKHFKECGLTN